MEQISLDYLLEQEKLARERDLPWFLQTTSAVLVKYTGESKTSLPKGEFGFINGVFGDSKSRSFRSRSATNKVSVLDLEPLKVTEFTQEEREMRYPKHFEIVEVVSNATMEVVDKGYLTTLTPDKIFIKDRKETGEFFYERSFDVRVHHFKGYRPKRMLVWKD